MRSLIAALFCMVVAAYGSLAPVAHAMAHAVSDATLSTAFEHHHDHDHHDHSVDSSENGDESPSQPDVSESHGAELHFSAIYVPPSFDALYLPGPVIRQSLAEIHPPTPLLAPDPDPDRG